MCCNEECTNEAVKCIQGLKFENNLKGRIHLGDLDVDGRMILKFISRNRMGECELPKNGV
jgi:hypothetical protein